MTVYLVSRHDGAQRWARLLQRQGLFPYDIDRYVDHLNAADVRRGDIVVGTLSLAEIAAVREHGARFLGLDLKVPPEYRVRDLSATEMAAFEATLSEYRVTLKDTLQLGQPRGARRRRKAQSAVTIMLVSRELMPQYLGFVHDPTVRVVLVVTDSMAERHNTLRKLLRNAPIAPERIISVEIPDDCAYAELLEHTHGVVDVLVDEPAERIVLNLTWETKLMSLAFHSAGQAALLEGHAVTLQYVDTGPGRIDHLGNGPTQAMRPLLGVSIAVLASGKPAAGCASSSPLFQRQMQRIRLHENLARLDPGVLGQLNMVGDEMDALVAQRRKKPFHALRCDTGDLEDAQRGMFHLLGTSQTRSLLKRLRGKLGQSLVEHGVLVGMPADVDSCVRLEITRPNEIGYLKGAGSKRTLHR